MVNFHMDFHYLVIHDKTPTNKISVIKSFSNKKGVGTTFTSTQETNEQFKHFNHFYYKMSTYKKDNVQALKLNKMKTKRKKKNILAMPLLNSSLVVVINKVQNSTKREI